MKHLKIFSYALFGVLVLFVSCTYNQQRKIDEKEFCRNLNSFVNALDDLAVASEGNDYNAFYKAYEKAEKEWNRLVESAERLEDIQMEQSVNEYNKLVTKINKITADPDNPAVDYEIDDNIQKTADKIADIQTTVCD